MANSGTFTGKYARQQVDAFRFGELLMAACTDLGCCRWHSWHMARGAVLSSCLAFQFLRSFGAHAAVRRTVACKAAMAYQPLSVIDPVWLLALPAFFQDQQVQLAFQRKAADRLDKLEACAAFWATSGPCRVVSLGV